MTLELWNTFATFGTFAVIAATAIAALVQLRHLRAGNQINAMLSIGEEFGGKSFTDAAGLITGRKLEAALNDPVYRDYTIALSSGQAPPAVEQQYVELRRAVLLIGNAYEELGILVKNGIVEKSLFLDRYCWVILLRWKELEKQTALTREATGQGAIWENFEYIAVLSEDWLQHQHSTYPKGMRRMQLTNPWPIAQVRAT